MSPEFDPEVPGRERLHANDLMPPACEVDAAGVL